MIVRGDAEPGQACVRPWTEAEYFADRDHVSRSQLMKLTDSIAAFEHSDDEDRSYLGTEIKGARLGTVVHMHRLERAEYDARVIPWAAATGKNAIDVLAALAHVDRDRDPSELGENARTWLVRAWNGEEPPKPRAAVRAKKATKTEGAREAVPAYSQRTIDSEAKAAIYEVARAFDLMLIRPQDIELVLAIEAAIDRCPTALKYLDGRHEMKGKPPIETLREVAVTWTDADSGVACRARLDLVLVYENCVIVVDIKTTLKTPSASRFGDVAVRQGYYHQAAFYTRAAFAVFGKRAHFVWVAAKNCGGLVAAAHKPDRETLKIAEDTVSTLLLRLAKIQQQERARDRWETRMNTATPSRGGAAIMAAIQAEADKALAETTAALAEERATASPES